MVAITDKTQVITFLLIKTATGTVYRSEMTE
jgi:hypothetical protein